MKLSDSVSDGKKMSKSLRNYPDPNIIINTYGADATRFVLLTHSKDIRSYLIIQNVLGQLTHRAW